MMTFRKKHRKQSIIILIGLLSCSIGANTKKNEKNQKGVNLKMK